MANPHSYIARSNIMWAATQALNKWLSQGVIVDWATHMIGHELTAYLGMDHARTLACIQVELEGVWHVAARFAVPIRRENAEIGADGSASVRNYESSMDSGVRDRGNGS